MNFYKRFIGDYRKKTARLSPLEHGVYNLLLDEHYATEAPLPLDLDEIFQIIGARGPSDEEATKKILNRYWIETPEGWTNERAMEEMAAFRDKSNKARGSARKRWDAKADADACANAPSNADAKADADAGQTHMLARVQSPDSSVSSVAIAPSDTADRGNGFQPLDAEKRYFDEGKKLLGKTAGGLLKKLLDAKGSALLAHEVLDEASHKQDPKEWIGAVLREASRRSTQDEVIEQERKRIWGQ